MLPRHSRCILGLEDEENGDGGAAAAPPRLRRPRRGSSNVEALRPLFSEFLRQPDPAEQNMFNVPVCIQLLGVLPPTHPLVGRIQARVTNYFDADEARAAPAPPTVPRRRARHAESDSDA
jgi:hypothetical protein